MCSANIRLGDLVSIQLISERSWLRIALSFVVFFLSIRCAFMYIVVKFHNVVKKPHIVKAQFCCVLL